MSTVVLYIAGTGRSGSTVLANILGEVDGVFAAGEVRYLWQRGLKEGRLCGCGLPVRECPVWSRVLATAGQLDDAERVDAIVSMLQRTGRIRNLPGVLAGSVVPRLDPAESHALAPARDALGDLYAAIAGVTGCRVIVDSSKLPAYANVLAATPGIDLRVVHLIRDPRGAAYSWSSRKTLADGATRSHMEQIGPAKSAVLWDVWNFAGGVLFKGSPDRYLRLRYEDFVSDPPGSIRTILGMVGMEDAELPFINGHEARTTPNHSVAGNPDRLRHGVITLRSDDRWRHAMKPRNRRLVSTLASPLLLRYGYPLRPAVVHASPDETIFDRAPVGEGPASRLARRVRRHLRWGRTEGFSRLVEEDELNPVTRVRVAAAKWGWRRSHPRAPGLATPVYLVGLQRSGTNMLARGLDIAPEFEVHNENDRAVFDHFLLRDDDVIRRVVLASRHEYVLFKPLCDSHRVDHLLDSLGTPSPGRAIWAYRDVDGRVRSAVSKFGRNNLLTLRDIAAGKGAGMWQAQRLSAATLAEIASYDYETMTAETAAALFWWIRNGLYFETGLDRRDDVLLASYRDMLATPVEAMQAICTFLGLTYRPALIEHISPRGAVSRLQLDIDPRVRALCDHLQDRLDEALRGQRDGAAA
ncbi:MAG: sulfotransferase [Candidatus Dormibacteria bacterium]